MHNTNSVHRLVICVLLTSMSLWAPAALDSIKYDLNGTVYLENYCNSSPQDLLVTSKDNYGGKLVFFPYQYSCNMTFKFVVQHPVTDLKHFLYFNIRESTMPLGDVLKIYQVMPYAALSKIKVIRRDDEKKGMEDSAMSFGQMKTSYSSGSIILFLQLEVTTSGTTRPKMHDQVILQYTTVIESVRSVHGKEWVYCSALNGYVNRNLSCNASRIACPDKFVTDSDGKNRAFVDRRPCGDGMETSGLYREDFRAPPRFLSNGWNVTNAMRTANNSTVYTRPENVEIADGLLRITAQTMADNATHTSYYTGQVSSGSFATLTYGEVEIRAKLPLGPNMTIITVIRLVNLECQFDDSPACQEGILVAELSSDKPNCVTTGVSNGFRTETNCTQQSLTDSQFHVFKLTWTEELITWFIDEIELYNLSVLAVIPSARMQIVVELSISPDSDPVNATAELLVDYIILREHAQSSSRWEIWVAVVTPTTVTVLAICAWYWKDRRHRLKDEPENRHGPLKFAYKLEEGEFGVIWKATAFELLDHPVPCTVAVKCVRDRSDDSHRKFLMSEATIQNQIGKHRNIVGLLGVIMSDQMFLILEYSPHGNLLQHLRDHAKMFSNNGCGSYNYINAKISTAFSGERIPCGWPLTTADLVDFVYQISWGMEYLANKNVIHRDLAARNILVFEKKVLKIGDFGMAKQTTDYYHMTDVETAKVPAKWMAPESLQKLMFSQKSDVWSFGVVAWEIFSFGKVPYDNILELFSYDAFTSALVRGLRLLKPKECPVSMFDIMLECWKVCDQERPTFAELNQKIEPLVEKQSRRNYVEATDPYVILRIPRDVTGSPVTDEESSLNQEQLKWRAVKATHRGVSAICQIPVILSLTI